MKKILIAATVILGIVGLIIVGSTGNESAETVRQKDAAIMADHREGQSAKDLLKQNQDENVYEANIDRLRQFVEAVYNADSKETKDHQALLSGIATDDVIKEYTYSHDGTVREMADYEVSVHHAKYMANMTCGVALFELKTVTEINESTSFYLLQVSFDQGMISRVDRFMKIDE